MSEKINCIDAKQEDRGKILSSSTSEAVSWLATECNSSAFAFVVRLATVTNAQLKQF